MRRCSNQIRTDADEHASIDHAGMNSYDMLQQRTSAAEIAHGLQMQRRAAANTQKGVICVGVRDEVF